MAERHLEPWENDPSNVSLEPWTMADIEIELNRRWQEGKFGPALFMMDDGRIHWFMVCKKASWNMRLEEEP